MLRVCTDLTGCPENYDTYGTAVAEQVDAALARPDGSRPSVLYIRATGSSCKVKNSEGTVLGEMLAALDCENIADRDGALLEQLSMEAIIRDDPEYIFVVLQSAAPADAQAVLESQKTELADTQSKLSEKEAEIAAQQAQMEALGIQLDEQQAQINTQQAQLDNQQAQIEQLVGMKTRIITSLSSALRSNSISATVDPTTGSIALESDVLFESGEYKLTDAGKRFVDDFLPVYLHVLFSEEYRDYVSEIIIEGHTDSVGGYLTNLELSQQRALAVASYVLGDECRSVSPDMKNELRAVVTVNGRSYSDRVFNADGTEDMDASRRVVFKFRLTDEQMIQQMRQILEPCKNMTYLDETVSLLSTLKDSQDAQIDALADAIARSVKGE